MIGLLLILLLIVVLLSFRIFYENHTFVMRYYEVKKRWEVRMREAGKSYF